MAKLAYSYSHCTRYNTVLILELGTDCTVFLQGEDSDTFCRDVLHNKSRQTNKIINLVCGEYFPIERERGGTNCCVKHRNQYNVVSDAIAQYI